MRYAIDTNVLLDRPEIVLQEQCVMLACNLRELEKLKRDPHIGFKARRCARFLEEANGTLTYDLKDYVFGQNTTFSQVYVDNQVIQACIDNRYGLITEDILLKQKARAYNLEVKSLKNFEKEVYRGVQEVALSNEDMAAMYQTPEEFFDSSNWKTHDFYRNQYIIFQDENKRCLEKKKWDGHNLIEVCTKPKALDSHAIGNYRPKDMYQACAFDSLVKDDFTMLMGGAGSGKTLLSMAYIFAQLQSKSKEKCYIIFNPCDARGTAKIGFRPGDTMEKMLASSLGSMLMTKVASPKDLGMFFGGDQLIIIPASDMRGLDVRNSILYLPEGQNYNCELLKLAIQRVSDGSKLIIEGDVDAQVDSHLYEGINNGMRAASDIFKGEKCFSMVHLQNNYRSDISRIAEKM